MKNFIEQGRMRGEDENLYVSNVTQNVPENLNDRKLCPGITNRSLFADPRSIGSEIEELAALNFVGFNKSTRGRRIWSKKGTIGLNTETTTFV